MIGPTIKAMSAEDDADRQDDEHRALVPVLILNAPCQTTLAMSAAIPIMVVTTSSRRTSKFLTWLISWREHALELLAIHHLQKSGRHRHRGVLRIAAGGECVRARVIDDVHLRHRHAVADRQRLDDVVELLVLLRVRLVGADRRQHGGRTEVVRVGRRCDPQQRRA